MLLSPKTSGSPSWPGAPPGSRTSGCRCARAPSPRTAATPCRFGWGRVRWNQWIRMSLPFCPLALHNSYAPTPRPAKCTHRQPSRSLTRLQSTPSRSFLPKAKIFMPSVLVTRSPHSSWCSRRRLLRRAWGTCGGQGCNQETKPRQGRFAQNHQQPPIPIHTYNVPAPPALRPGSRGTEAWTAAPPFCVLCGESAWACICAWGTRGKLTESGSQSVD